MAACRRNPLVLRRGWADRRRRASLLVVAVSLPADTASSSRLARLAPRPSAAAGDDGTHSDMNEPVKPAVDAYCNKDHLWSPWSHEQGVFSTVNHSDIRVLSCMRRTGTHDYDSSGAASI